MAKLKALICTCCGGQLDETSLNCKMCGTAHILNSDGEAIRFIEYSSKIETFCGAVHIPRYMVETNPQMAMEMSLSQLAEKMVEKIMPLMEYEQSYEPITDQYITRGRIRVAIPNTQGFRYREMYIGHPRATDFIGEI